MREKRSHQGPQLSGVYRAASGPFGFVTPEDGGSDVFIPPRKEGGAWDGDRVTVCLSREEPGEDERRSGRVLRVLERAHSLVVGRVERRERALWLFPDSDKLPPVKLLGKMGEDAPRQKGAARMESYGGHGASPTGKLERVFGSADSLSAAVEAILYENDIPEAFPQAVLDQAEAVPQRVEEAALRGRLDLRGETVVTIDGAGAMDLDDAVSLGRDEAGRWVLGVHIADVSHYVPEGSPLDAEALERGTSVYFANRVVPMLPKPLSNGICSLHPGVDRLTLSCMMVLDANGEVAEHTICKSVIRSAYRLTYEDCNAMLPPEGADALKERYAAVLPMLRDMAALSAKLERRRALRGALELDSAETAVLCDEEGRPVEIRRRERGVSERMIESFMLCANETVAEHLFSRKKPCVYRVHEKPSLEKTQGLKTMLEPFGYTFETADHFTLRRILAQAEEKGEGPLVSSLVLRSLMKARYDVEELGHFGLAAKYYCHFTSPIRRYPDLMVHRILTRVLEDGERWEEGTAPWEKRSRVLCARAAQQSSRRELAAQNAEREIEKRYMAAYMADHVGETFPGTVSGVSKFGLFILLPSGVEGFLGVEALPPDRYHFDPQRLTLRGERGERYGYGMELEVLCERADPMSGLVDFALPDVPASLRPRKERKEPAGKKSFGHSRAKPRKNPPRHRAGGRRK